MGRIHFFEIEDQRWVPVFIRDAITEFLLLTHKIGKLNQLFIPKIKEVLLKTKQKTIIDLGSGAGGPIPSIVKELHLEGIEVNAILTDLFPNEVSIQKFNESKLALHIFYEPTAVDATSVPSHLVGLRTMIASFHHLDNAVASSLLENAQTSNQPIAVFEGFGRNFTGFIGLLPSFLMGFLLVPFFRPFRVSTLIFTYLVPVIPFIIFFDGWVSFFRIYSPAELTKIVESLPKKDSYFWEVGTVGFQKAPYILGYPK